jgi:hypothetical protein
MYSVGGDDDFCYDGLPLPPTMTYCTTCPAMDLLNCELLAISDAAAAPAAADAAAAAAAAGILYY